MELVNLGGEKVKSEPKIVNTTEVVLVLNHLDNGAVMPNIVPPEGMDHFALLGVLDYFHNLVLKK